MTQPSFSSLVGGRSSAGRIARKRRCNDRDSQAPISLAGVLPGSSGGPCAQCGRAASGTMPFCAGARVSGRHSMWIAALILSTCLTLMWIKLLPPPWCSACAAPIAMEGLLAQEPRRAQSVSATHDMGPGTCLSGCDGAMEETARHEGQPLCRQPRMSVSGGAPMTTIEARNERVALIARDRRDAALRQ